MLPNSDYEPIFFGQRGIDQPVSPDVGLELGAPVRTVCLRVACVERTAVPEAAVEKHGDTGASEDHIGTCPTLSRTEEEILPEAEPKPVKLRAEAPFGCRVARAVREHPVACSNACGPRTGGDGGRAVHAFKA